MLRFCNKLFAAAILPALPLFSFTSTASPVASHNLAQEKTVHDTGQITLTKVGWPVAPAAARSVEHKNLQVNARSAPPPPSLPANTLRTKFKQDK